MPCHVEPSSVSIRTWLADMLMRALMFLTEEQKRYLGLTSSLILTEEIIQTTLCKACKFLTADQMYSIKGLDIYQDLHTWYIEHLINDFASNYDNPDPSEKNLCLKEAKRLGFIIKKDGVCFSIQSQKLFLEKK